MQKESLRMSSFELNQPIQAAVKQQSSIKFEIGKAYQESATSKIPDQVSDPSAEHASTLLMNADVLIRFGEIDLAKHLVRQALSFNSHNPEALRRLITCMDPNTEATQLIKVHQALLKADFGFQTLANLGHAFYKVGNDSKAFENYRKALSTFTYEEKGLFEVYKNMGNILVKEGDYDGAEEFYNKAFTLKDDSDVLQVNLGTLDLQREDNEQALVRFRRALELNAKNDKAWVGLALVHNTMGDHVLAQANLENAIDVNPFNRTAVQLAAAWAIRDHKYDTAISYLETFLSQGGFGYESDGNLAGGFDEDLSLVLVHLFSLIGRQDLAAIEIERLLLWNPQHPQAILIEEELRAQIQS